MNSRGLSGLLVWVTGCAALMTSAAYAHYPTLACNKDASDNSLITCEAGYSDASLAGEVELRVYSYDDELLDKVKTASDGSAQIKAPEMEFYIKFDPGHESPAEFDYVELN